MRGLPVLVLPCLLAFGSSQPVLAATWCSTHHPNAVACEDFDSYIDGQGFSKEWPLTGQCASTLSLDGGFTSSPPYAGKMNCQENGVLGYSSNGITDSVRGHFGSGCTSGAVVGTDLNPLVLELVMNAQSPVNRAPYDNSFFTLGSGNAHAPTDWAWSPFCGCSSSDPRYPIICQQESPAADCPPIATAPAVPVIAAGFLAYLDNDPCHCGGSWHSPINEHLSFFDGRKWYRLRQGLFPGSGDFRLRHEENRIKITIKASKLKVELTCPYTGEYSWCEIPGGYAGPFNTMSTGFHVSCQLKTGAWECRGSPTCNDAKGVPYGGVPRYDNIVLHGGVCYSAPGACCFADTSCTDGLYGADCQAIGGTFNGDGTTCATKACCPALKADHDLDNDVDLEDFGWFQSCLAGQSIPPPNVPCQCADFDQEGDVDAADLATFLGCMLGPEVPANPSCID